MDAVPVIVTGQEPEWLREQFHQLVPGGALTTEFVFEDRCPAGVGSCVVVTDDLRGAGLRRLLFRCVDRMTGDRLIVLAWDEARHATALLGIPLIRLHRPVEEREAALAALRCLTRTGRPPRFAYVLDPSLPPSLAVALRLVLNRAGDPLGPPPPRRVSDLAVQVGCSRGTLSRASAAVGLSLPAAMAAAQARWLLARVALTGMDDPVEMARCVGYTSIRSLRRLVRRELHLGVSELHHGSVERCEARLSSMLAPVLECPEPNTSSH